MSLGSITGGGNDMRRIVSRLESEIADLKRASRAIPARLPAGGVPTPVVPTDVLPWLVVTVAGGNLLNASAPTVYGIKRVVGEAKASVWTHLPRRATAIATKTAGGTISAVTVLNRGSAYSSAPSVTIAAPSDPSGVQATATAAIADARQVIAAKITYCGSGYWGGASVAFSAPPTGGTTATGSAVIRLGKVVAIAITGAGDGYTTAPSITITPTQGGSGAAAEPIMSSGQVISFTMNENGSGYATTPEVVIGAPDPLALSTASSDGIGWGTVSGVYSGDSVISVGDAVCLVNDNRSTLTFPLVCSADYDGVTIQGSDAVISWAGTLVRMSDADADADGIMPAWVPMGGGE